MLTVGGLVNLLIYLVILGLILAVVFWALSAIPVPEPFNRIIRVIAVVIVALIVILLLLQLAGIATTTPILTSP